MLQFLGLSDFKAVLVKVPCILVGSWEAISGTERTVLNPETGDMRQIESTSPSLQFPWFTSQIRYLYLIL